MATALPNSRLTRTPIADGQLRASFVRDADARSVAIVRRRHRPCGRALTALTALVAVLAGLTACGTSHKIPAPGASIGEPMDAPLPAAVARTVLVNSTGHRFDLAALRGQTVVISDMMTLCQETCPIDTANVVDAARAAEQAGVGRKITFLSVTIDPERDTATRLAAFRALYGAAPADWEVATGAPSQIKAFWAALGTYIQRVPDKPPLPRDWLTHKPLTYDLTHSDELYFVSAEGRERFLLEGAPHLAPNAPLPATLRRFMDATGEQNIRHPDPSAWTLNQELQVLSWLAGRSIRP